MELSRRALLAAAGASGGMAALASAGSNDGENGNVYGGTMALEEAYNVAGDLWIGPASARSNVEAQSGRVYIAADEDVEYYGDGGAWQLKNVGSAQQPVPEVHGESVQADVARTTSTETVTVNVPSDFGTVVEAVEHAAEYQLPAGVEIVVNIESGHTITEDIFLTGGYYAHIRIASEDATVPVSADVGTDTDLIRLGNAAFGPRLDCQIDAQGNCRDGVRVDEASIMVVLDGGVDNAGRKGLYVQNAGTAAANVAQFQNAGEEGIDVFRSSVLTANGIDVSGAGLDGVRTARSCLIEVGDAILSGVGQDAVRCSRLSKVNIARNTDAQDATRHAIRCTRHGFVEANNCDLRGSGDDAVLSRDGGRVDLFQSDVSDSANSSGGRGLYAYNGGEIYAREVTVTHTTEPCVLATNMGEVNVPDSTLGENDQQSAVIAEEGAEVSVRGSSITGAATHGIEAIGAEVCCIGASSTSNSNNDIHRVDGSIVRAESCTTSTSSSGGPHEDDINFPSNFNTIEAEGIIFASDFESSA